MIANNFINKISQIIAWSLKLATLLLKSGSNANRFLERLGTREVLGFYVHLSAMSARQLCSKKAIL